MTCHDARPQLSALLDDALSVAEHQALEAHLAGCAECRRELEQLRGTVALLGRLPPAHAPAGFVDRVMDAAYRPPWWRRLLDTLFRPLRVKLPLEAAAALLVGVSALYVYQHAPEVQELARQESPASGPASLPAPAQPPAPPATSTAEEALRSQDADHRATRAPAAPPAPRDKAVPPARRGAPGNSSSARAGRAAGEHPGCPGREDRCEAADGRGAVRGEGRGEAGNEA